MHNRHYVYEWYNVNTGEVFYVGKGTGSRVSDSKRRNKAFLNYIKNNECNYRILISNLCEEEALLVEKNKIKEYRSKKQCICNFDDGGKRNAVLIGDKNFMFGVSPKERMSPEVYNTWREKQLANKIGERNPNFGNKSLSKIYKENPELAKEKQSRPRSKNGRATPIKMYTTDMELVKEFNLIIECIEYLIANNISKTENLDSLYGAIWKSNKNHTPLYGFYFKY